MARIIKTSWTPDQLKRLKDMAESGASPIRIAAALNRPVVGVRARARQLGIELPTLSEMRAKIRAAEANSRDR